MAQPGTGGTIAATTLTANLVPGSFFPPAGSAIGIVEPDAAIATINQLIKDDRNFNEPAPGAGPMWGWSRNGMLYIPNRGAIMTFPGDCVMVDTQTGWPILVSARALAGGAWATTAT